LEVHLTLGFDEDVEDGLVVEAPLRVRSLEERSDEVVRVAEVARPADQVDVARGALVHVLHVVRAPRSALRRHLEARLLEARRDGRARMRPPAGRPACRTAFATG